MERFHKKQLIWMGAFIACNAFAVAVVYELGALPGVALMLGTYPLAHKMFPEY